MDVKQPDADAMFDKNFLDQLSATAVDKRGVTSKQSGFNNKNATGKKKMSPMQAAQANSKSKALAIAAHCYHICRGETAVNSHTAKLEIKNCPDLSCPLWPHRGWQKMTGGSVKSKCVHNPKQTPPQNKS